MDVARHLYSLAVSLILSVGLLTSQVCSVVCASSKCISSATVKRSEQSQKTDHCHQHKPQPEPQQPGGSHQCLTHDDVVSLQPTNQLLNIQSLQQIQPAVMEPSIPADLLFGHSTNEALKDRLFRSPPRSQRYSILRI